MSSASLLVLDCLVHEMFRLDLSTCFYVGLKCIARYKMLRILHEYESIVYTDFEWLFAPASPASAYAYGMDLAAPAPVYGMAPGAPIYATPVPVAAPAYEQTTESYYTAPAPLYTTNIPPNLQPTPTPYGALPLPIYSAQRYGSMPSPLSPTASPWYK
ncbi:hypothetical protein DAPPUDRAFT_116153 [Daphnia pulex]|uniref:Uncharacterized protein n=1 Tax=Daphnia pulex TaxID=6669 RepID=E9HNQ8_DAPPU|nr:hypothetical protein DAPPUDRAFT_116153 [Daphnia pulex]|eukprot:EFX66598.1 hypothetical protein DAPPUDRAFT_116153 [Daphnia pulex]